jgi:protein SCO1
MRLIALLLLAQLALLGGCGDAPADDASAADAAASDPEDAIRQLPYPLQKPDFTFTDASGNPFDFRRETEGLGTLLFFGYTNCPDVCPVHLANIAAVLGELPPEVARRIKVVFVSTDPERDTPERIKSWLAAIDPEFVGLRAPIADVNAIEAALLLPSSIVQSAHGAPLDSAAAHASGEYFVGHASAVVAFAPDGFAREMYGWGTRQQDWRRVLPQLIR